MLFIPDKKQDLLRFSLDLIDKCRSSAGVRTAYCRQINAIAETGRDDGTKSLINMLNKFLDETSAHLYSPTELRFTIDFEANYDKNVYERAAVVSRVLTRDWERSNTDMLFGRGVRESLKYGATVLKQWVQNEGEEQIPVYKKKLVMPWQFGVYREDYIELENQPVMVETTMLTMPEVWRRIYHLPGADKLYERIRSNAGTSGADQPQSFFHQILSTSQINTGIQSMTRPPPGGIVQLNNDPNYAIIGPEVVVDMVRLHELWVQGQKDYVTIQIIEPDIIINPLFLDGDYMIKKTNALIPGEINSGLHPYTLIQPNEKTGYIWGQSELSDLIEPQMFLTTSVDDIKRLFGLQVDKILAFIGFDGINDENYDQMRAAGYFSNPTPGADVKDLTPHFPPEAIPLVKFIMEFMNSIRGFPPIMQGQGETGVRSQGQTNTLMKNASPHLRDRSLLVERQCAQAADLRLSLMEAKDGRNYWTDGTNPETIKASTFLLNDIPEDRRVAVDSHSSSPIFADDHAQLTAFGAKMGFLDGEDVIDDLPFPDKEKKKTRFRERQKAKQEQFQKLLEKYPELGESLAKKQLGGRRR